MVYFFVERRWVIFRGDVINDNGLSFKGEKRKVSII